MGVGISIFLIAVGAVLTFAVNAVFSGIDINTVGVILMIVGAIGLLVDLAIFMPRRRQVVVRDGVTGEPGAAQTTRTVEHSTF
jgi:beta-lactamase regulating signal transducer with metallopeptidase domain